MELTKQAQEERRTYMREYMAAYRRKNPDRIKEINNRYWNKRSMKAEA